METVGRKAVFLLARMKAVPAAKRSLIKDMPCAVRRAHQRSSVFHPMRHCNLTGLNYPTTSCPQPDAD